MNPFKIIGYFALIGGALLAATWATREMGPGQVVENDDELSYRWQPSDWEAANDN